MCAGPRDVYWSVIMDRLCIGFGCFPRPIRRPTDRVARHAEVALDVLFWWSV